MRTKRSLLNQFDMNDAAILEGTEPDRILVQHVADTNQQDIAQQELLSTFDGGMAVTEMTSHLGNRELGHCHPLAGWPCRMSHRPIEFNLGMIAPIPKNTESELILAKDELMDAKLQLIPRRPRSPTEKPVVLSSESEQPLRFVCLPKPTMLSLSIVVYFRLGVAISFSSEVMFLPHEA